MERQYRSYLLAASSLLLMFSGTPAQAMYVEPDLTQVPVDRLIRNLERRVAQHPDSVQARLLLARVHAMAFAKKSDQATVLTSVDMKLAAATSKDRRLAEDIRDSVVQQWGPDTRGSEDASLWAGFVQGTDADAKAGCYAETLPRLTSVSGAVVVTLAIQGGKMGVTVKQSTVREANLERCLVARLGLVRRPPYVRPAPKRMTVELRFELSSRALEGWYGFDDFTVPVRVESAKDQKAKAAAAKHLERAIAQYRLALQSAPKNALARLGLGWCLQQRGDMAQAIKAYREAFKRAWAEERKRTSLGLGAHPIALEAATALTTLLDRSRDRREIARLTKAADKLSSLPRPVTPIVIPLKDGVMLADVVDSAAKVRFDLDGSGLRRRWGWLQGDAGWLVYDHLGTGEITSGLQLLGSVSFWAFWANGYEALSALDDNGDGELTGLELRFLAVWKDADGDGQSDPGEVRSLNEYGIVGLRVDYERDAEGTLSSPRGLRLENGAVRPTWDWVPTAGRVTH